MIFQSIHDQRKKARGFQMTHDNMKENNKAQLPGWVFSAIIHKRMNTYLLVKNQTPFKGNGTSKTGTTKFDERLLKHGDWVMHSNGMGLFVLSHPNLLNNYKKIE